MHDVPTWVELIVTGTATGTFGAFASPMFRRVFSNRQVRAEAAKTEADATAVTVGTMVSTIEMLKGQLETVTVEMEALHAKVRQLTQLITVHEVWDAAMLAAAVRHGETPEPPPPLWPPAA